MKRILSVLLAIFLLSSVLSLTAFAEDTDTADTGAVEELARTGVTLHKVSNASELKSALTANDTGSVHEIMLTQDIYGTVGTASVNDDTNYVPVWCTVGKGQKILNLNKHTLQMQSDYCAICHKNAYMGKGTIVSLSNECLFDIPTGAELTVNGGYDSSKTGTILYNGVLLFKCDGIDQRDIFHVDGGTLTVNSGKFLPCQTARKYKWDGGTYTSGYEEWIQLNGTAVTVNSGTFTANGGYFEGRGLNTYFVNSNNVENNNVRNGALEINSRDTRINVYGGWFNGASHANCVAGSSYDASHCRFRAGRFSVDQNNTNIDVEYGGFGNIDSSTGAPGKMGLPVTASYSRTRYYCDPSYLYDTSNSNVFTFINMSAPEFYIEPVSKTPVNNALPKEDNAEIMFLRNGYSYEYSTTIAETWNVMTDHFLEIEPSRLYFPNMQNGLNDTVTQALTGTLTVRQASVAQTVVVSNRFFTAKRKGDSTTNWQINLKDCLTESERKSLTNGQKYTFAFDFDEQQLTQTASYHVSHHGDYCVTAAVSAASNQVKGTATSYLSNTDTVTVQLLQSGSVKYSTTVRGNAASYSIPNVANGSYTLRVSKKNHVTRDYSITVTGNKTQDVQICPIGDATNDGNVNMFDYNAVYKHVSKNPELADGSYQKACADVTKDGKVNMFDYNAIYKHVAKTNPLF
ncbi:MAG: hypothetical protein IJG87_07055 [Ruminococcus sp.]|nr:hypothetical protein [Ruminococcus sp.]